MSAELLQIQRALQQHLLNPSTASNALTIEAAVLETENVSRTVRLNIYANAYRARIVEALSTDFHMLHAYLGDTGFTELVHSYIEQYPSRYFSLRGIGGELVTFLQTTEPYSAHIDLHELAQFEWALCHAFDAADTRCACSADFFTLQPEQWPELTLQFVPALRVLELHSNAPAIWKALKNEQAPPAVAINSMPQHWLVWRRDLKLLFRPLDAIEKIAFEIFANGGAFADVCGALAETLPEEAVPQRVVALLQQWLSDALITAP